MSLKFRKKNMDELQRKSISEMQSAARFPVHIILENVRSMHNVGSVFRTADAFTVDGISLCGYTPIPPHRDIHKTALGATETVPWTYYNSSLEAIETLKQRGFHIIAVEQVHGSIPLQTFHNYPDLLPAAFILGNEVSGVSEETLEYADACIEIPQWGAKHSLNISVAGGVVLWEIMRFRKEV